MSIHKSNTGVRYGNRNIFLKQYQSIARTEMGCVERGIETGMGKESTTQEHGEVKHVGEQVKATQFILQCP